MHLNNRIRVWLAWAVLIGLIAAMQFGWWLHKRSFERLEDDAARVRQGLSETK
jgi:hypothetical protein